jgi:hypothetical protein
MRRGLTRAAWKSVYKACTQLKKNFSLTASPFFSTKYEIYATKAGISFDSYPVTFLHASHGEWFLCMQQVKLSLEFNLQMSFFFAGVFWSFG